MNREKRWCALSVICVLAAGCGTPMTTTPGNDAGPGDDAAASPDTGGGPGNDAGADAGVDSGGSPPGDAGMDAPTTTSGISVTGFASEAIPDGGRYQQVNLDGIPPWSDGIADLTIHNDSGAALVVHSITLTPVAPTEAYEWALNEPGMTARTPLTVSEESIAVDGAYTFGLFFQPIASGARDVTVDILYGSSQHYTFVVAARGRDNATLSPHVSAALERVFGRDNTGGSNSFEPGGLVADASGNLYFDGNVREWGDGFNTNVVLVRVAADGTLSWVRELQESYAQESRDIGNNGEIGGGEDSLAVDATHVYVAAERALSATAAFGCLVMQVDATTGALGWARHLNNIVATEDVSTAAQVLRCETVDASLPDRIIVSGQVADSAGGFVAALSKTDGSVIFARNFGSGATRVGALVVDASANRAYVGGIMNGGPFAARFDAVDGTAPTAAWIRPMGPSLSNIHGLALDASGTGLLAAFDVRGATTFFTGARIATSDGSIVWSRTWDGAGSSVDRSLSVTMHGGSAVFSGRIGFQPFDTNGDGFLLALDPATGDYDWGAFYYGGKGAEEIMNTLGTGIVSTGTDLWLLSYQTPGSHNSYHFWGRWYEANDGGTATDPFPFPDGDGSARLVDAALTAGTPGATALTTPPNFTAHVASIMASEWTDVTSMEEYEDPRVAEQAMFQAGTQAQLARLTITP